MGNNSKELEFEVPPAPERWIRIAFKRNLVRNANTTLFRLENKVWHSEQCDHFRRVDQFCCNKDVNFDTTACFFCNHNVSILFVCVCVCVCVSPGSPPSNAYFMGTIPANNISVLSIFFVCVSPGSPITSNAHFMGDLAGNSSKKSVLSIELYF